MRISDWSSDVCSSDLLLAYRNGADQAVDQLSDRLASTPADSVQGGTCLVVDGTCGEHGGASEEASELADVRVVSGAGEDLHADGVADRHVAGEESVHLVTGRRDRKSKRLNSSH